jgi:hypothetical protein
MAGEADPHVPLPPLAFVHASKQVPDDLAVAHRNNTARALLLPGAGDEGLRIADGSEQRLCSAMALVPRGEDPGRRCDVAVRERPDLD